MSNYSEGEEESLDESTIRPDSCSSTSTNWSNHWPVSSSENRTVQRSSSNANYATIASSSSFHNHDLSSHNAMYQLYQNQNNDSNSSRTRKSLSGQLEQLYQKSSNEVNKYSPIMNTTTNSSSPWTSTSGFSSQNENMIESHPSSRTQVRENYVHQSMLPSGHHHHSQSGHSQFRTDSGTSSIESNWSTSNRSNSGHGHSSSNHGHGKPSPPIKPPRRTTLNNSLDYLNGSSSSNSNVLMYQRNIHPSHQHSLKGHNQSLSKSQHQLNSWINNQHQDQDYDLHHSHSHPHHHHELLYDEANGENVYSLPDPPEGYGSVIKRSASNDAVESDLRGDLGDLRSDLSQLYSVVNKPKKSQQPVSSSGSGLRSTNPGSASIPSSSSAFSTFLGSRTNVPVSSSRTSNSSSSSHPHYAAVHHSGHHSSSSNHEPPYEQIRKQNISNPSNFGPNSNMSSSSNNSQFSVFYDQIANGTQTSSLHNPSLHVSQVRGSNNGSSSSSNVHHGYASVSIVPSESQSMQGIQRSSSHSNTAKMKHPPPPPPLQPHQVLQQLQQFQANKNIERSRTRDQNSTANVSNHVRSRSEHRPQYSVYDDDTIDTTSSNIENNVQGSNYRHSLQEADSHWSSAAHVHPSQAGTNYRRNSAADVLSDHRSNNEPPAPPLYAVIPPPPPADVALKRIRSVIKPLFQEYKQERKKRPKNAETVTEEKYFASIDSKSGKKLTIAFRSLDNSDSVLNVRQLKKQFPDKSMVTDPVDPEFWAEKENPFAGLVKSSRTVLEDGKRSIRRTKHHQFVHVGTAERRKKNKLSTLPRSHKLTTSATTAPSGTNSATNTNTTIPEPVIVIKPIEIESEITTTSSDNRSNSCDIRPPTMSPFDGNKEWAAIESIMASFVSTKTNNNVPDLTMTTTTSSSDADVSKSNLSLSLVPIKGQEVKDQDVSSRSPCLDINMTVHEWISMLGLPPNIGHKLFDNGFDDLRFLGPNVLELSDLVDLDIKDKGHQSLILDSSQDFPLITKLTSNTILDIDDWLTGLNLICYKSRFLENGFDTLDKIRKIWEVELNAVLDISKLGHRKRILASLGERLSLITDLGLEDLDFDKMSASFGLLTSSNPGSGSNPVSGSNPGSGSKVSPKPSQSIKSGSDDLVVIEDRILNQRRSPRAATPKMARRVISPPAAICRSPPPKPKASPNSIRTLSSSIASLDQWKHDPVDIFSGGIKYVSLYLGSTLVKQLRGIDTTRESIKKLKESTKDVLKIPSVILSISYSGVKFIDAQSNVMVCEHEIRNIHCACQDTDDFKHFAYITKDHDTGNHYCHVFSALNLDLATEIILTLGQSFEIAYHLAIGETIEALSSAYHEMKLQKSRRHSLKVKSSPSSPINDTWTTKDILEDNMSKSVPNHVQKSKSDVKVNLTSDKPSVSPKPKFVAGPTDRASGQGGQGDKQSGHHDVTSGQGDRTSSPSLMTSVLQKAQSIESRSILEPRLTSRPAVPVRPSLSGSPSKMRSKSSDGHLNLKPFDSFELDIEPTSAPKVEGKKAIPPKINPRPSLAAPCPAMVPPKPVPPTKPKFSAGPTPLNSRNSKGGGDF